MQSSSVDPNRRYFIYRCESNGDSVHEQLRSGYSKFIDLSKEQLLLDSYDRVLTPSYISGQESRDMFLNAVPSDYTWTNIEATTGILQPNGLYTWIKFAITPTDSQLSNSPVSRIYIGVALDKESAIKSENYIDYTWITINIYEGLINAQGTYTLIQYATSITGEGIGSSPTDKTYIGLKYNVAKVA